MYQIKKLSSFGALLVNGTETTSCEIHQNDRITINGVIEHAHTFIKGGEGDDDIIVTTGGSEALLFARL